MDLLDPALEATSIKILQLEEEDLSNLAPAALSVNQLEEEVLFCPSLQEPVILDLDSPTISFPTLAATLDLLEILLDLLVVHLEIALDLEETILDLVVEVHLEVILVEVVLEIRLNLPNPPI